MKFSLLYEMQIASPTRQSEAEMFRDCVDQAVLADKLGFSTVWAVEHHGLHEYSHCSAPEIFLSVVAAKTQQIRIGHGVTLTPQRYNHPLRIAERVATLDIYANGRVNWGSGKSGSMTEMGAFEVDRSTLNAEWIEALDMIPRMWQDEVFEYDGQFFKVPPVHVVPKPVQRPHPPVFGACVRKETVQFMASQGVGALCFATGDEHSLGELVQAYRDSFVDDPSRPYKANNHMALTPQAFCLPDDREAVKYGYGGLRFFNQTMGVYYFGKNRRVSVPKFVRRTPPTGDEIDAYIAHRGTPEAAGLPVIGDPAYCREVVARYASTGVDELILLMQVGLAPGEKVLESIKTFGEEVMPHFQ